MKCLFSNRGFVGLQFSTTSTTEWLSIHKGSVFALTDTEIAIPCLIDLAIYRASDISGLPYLYAGK
jgi:hypothetical protein